jgi:DNA-binding NarL/FixJ family response regulator
MLNNVPSYLYYIFLNMNINVAILDDHPLVLNGIVSMLSGENHISIFGKFSHSNAFFVAIEKHQPDVLLLDLQLQETTGTEVLSVLKQKYPGIKVIILTSVNNLLVIKTLMAGGASGYILKTIELERITEAIDRVYKGEIYLSEEVKDLLAKSAISKKNILGFNDDLSAKEIEILRLIAGENTTQEISEKLRLSPRTIDNYRLGLMQKLGAKNMIGMVKKAIMLGLVDH